MLLHPGRLRTAEAEPLVRVSIVSMLVVANLPAEIVVTAHVTHHPSVAGEEEPPITLRFRRGSSRSRPSGPIESKKTFTLRLPQLGQSVGAALVVRFELHEATRTLDFCDTAPLLIEKAPPPEKSSQLNGVANDPPHRVGRRPGRARPCSCGCGHSPRSPYSSGPRRRFSPRIRPPGEHASPPTTRSQ